MHLIFLGTASCYPTKHRGVSCTAVKFSDGDVWMFDCGEGSQIQMQKVSINPGRLKKIFITHLHGDHLFGIQGIMCTLGTLERTDEFTLEIYGPLGLRRYIRETLSLSRSPLNYTYIVHELVPLDWQYPEELKDWKVDEVAGVNLHPQEILGKQIQCSSDTWILFEDKHGSVKAGALVHRVPCFGYVITEPDRPGTLNISLLRENGIKPGPIYGRIKLGETIVLENGCIIKPSDVLDPPIPGKRITILGDTKDSSGMIHIAMNSDLVVHEATYEDGMEEKAVNHGHSTPKMAVQFAQQIHAKLLILTHFSQRYKLEGTPSVDILLSEATASIERLGFECSVGLAYDNFQIDLSRTRKDKEK